MNHLLRQEVEELLYQAIENAASPEQIERLNTLMESSLDVQQYAVDYYFMAAALHKSNTVASASLGTEHEVNELYNLLEEMAREEKTAPIIEMIPEYSTPERTYRKVEVIRRPVRKINRLSLGITITSLAAFLFLLAYVRLTPPQESVAVLRDSITAQWQGAQEDISRGFLFYNTDVPRTLKAGIVELEFEYGATVVIEGPSEFVCKSDNQITLYYGRLYARVPSQATGFTVETGHSRIVDLGTEFGVQVNVDGTTELHVFKGITKLLTGEMKNTETLSVTEGQAREVSSDGGFVREVPLKENGFVKQINSKTDLVRKGQKLVDLADIVGGGNGFGTGQRDVGLNPAAGQMTEVSQAEINRKADNTYHSVSTHPFIDGVFVPNGQTKQVISSLGHVFRECPITQGNYFTEISNAPETVDRMNLVLGGVNYSQSESGSLFLHANLGITYDINAIRSQLDDVSITRFQSTIGICDSAWRPCNADFWILVDGQLRYRREKVQQKGILDTVEIELSENDRFLTLVTTDGGDPDERAFEGGTVTSMDSDWCLFARPVLILE